MNNLINEKRRCSFPTLNNGIQANLTKPQTLEEYFLIIGVDPKICLKEYLYNTSINDLNEHYSKDDFRPRILSKFPPINKQYINIDSSIIDIVFQDGFKLEKFLNQPKPIIEHYLLENSFYSINYPLKYVTCLKIYENLENYLLLKNEIQDKLGDDYLHNTFKMNTGKKKKNDIINAIGNLDINSLKRNERFKSEIDFNNKEKNNKNINDNIDNYKNYYFPKILCLVSTQHFFKEQTKILKQIYTYFLDNTPKKIPLEKKILTILLNIPIPPKGLLEIEYNLQENYEKVKIKGEKMNKIENLDDELNIIFSRFSINKILIIFKYILFETKTIIFSTKINELTYFIYGIISLLFPFHHSFQVSSSIPNGAYDVLESISPYILGINSKFRINFFKENKIDLSDLDLFIIDLDEKKIKIAGKDNAPQFPKSILRPLHDGLEEIIGIKKHKSIKDINFKEVRLLFFDFLVNLLTDYDFYLKKDYFKNKLSNSGIKNLFKIKEFVESHSSNEKVFYKKFTETQMFSDFIYKKMIPKNLNEKFEILLVDEALIKKKNKKLFTKKKSTVFLDSKDYEYSRVYEVPHSKILSKREKKYFLNEEDRNNLLLYGQKINEEKEEKSNEVNFTFEYYVFPILNKSFFDSPPLGEYFLAPDSIVFSDVDRANTDILSKTLNNPNNIGNKKTLEEEMQNYIYLTYIELWSYSYWFLDFSEKDIKFNQLLEILNKITHHEVELFDHLFEALNKSKESDKILQLYDILLKYNIVPSSYIYSTVNTILNKHKLVKSYSNNNFFRINKDINEKGKKNQKRTFHSMNEGNILGDKVIFYLKQPCPECYKDIDIIEVSLNFRNMVKEIFWAKCPLCGKYIIPKIDVLLGNEINVMKNDYDESINSSKFTKFVLHSPYELKNNIKNIINKEGFSIFLLENIKEKYPSLFWSCVWYFKINKIDLDIILPYEWTNIQKWNNKKKLMPSNLTSFMQTDNEKDKKTKQLYIKKKQKKSKKPKIKKKYSNDILLINSSISLQIDDNKQLRNSPDYNNSSIGSLFDLYRISTSLSSINKSSKTVNFNKDNRYSAESFKDEYNFKIDISKKQTVKINMPFNLTRVRLNTLSQKNLLSPSFKPRKLFENIYSSDLLSIKEKEGQIVSPFIKDSYQDDFNGSKIYSNKKSSNKVFNFEEEDNYDIFGFKRNRSFYQYKTDKIINIEELDISKRNNSMKNKKIDLYCNY